MSRNFCAHCGTAITWRALEHGRPETKHRCPGCGCELYRNPEVHVLCLVYQGQEVEIRLLGGPLSDHETIENAAIRALADSGLTLSDTAELKVFALVSDLDADRVHVVFRAPVARMGEAGASPHDCGLGSWAGELVAQLRRDIQSGQLRVHCGTVREGGLSLEPAH